MTDKTRAPVEFDVEADELDVATDLSRTTSAAVVSGTDWTAETIVSQLKRQNIQLNPQFQRRDAWKRDRKSRFIESLIVGLPIPQIVLAESKTDRGKFIVLDGKQRLLAILQYWGLGEGQNNAYQLSGLTLRKDLKGATFKALSSVAEHESDYNALVNQSIRTVVIRNWKDSDFLHTVFLRLNTGSVTLSPQELRQALLPGPFTTYIDEAAAASESLRTLLNVDEPDARMRDIEILARFLAFRFFAPRYPGRMKEFLDYTFEQFNTKWDEVEKQVKAAVDDFEKGVEALIRTLKDTLARKPDSPQFNRAIFDALIFFHSQAPVRTALKGKDARVRTAYGRLFESEAFVQAIERDTASAGNTATRLKLWSSALGKIAGKTFAVPTIPLPASSKRKTSKKAGKRPRTKS